MLTPSTILPPLKEVYTDMESKIKEHGTKWTPEQFKYYQRNTEIVKRSYEIITELQNDIDFQNGAIKGLKLHIEQLDRKLKGGQHELL